MSPARPDESPASSLPPGSLDDVQIAWVDDCAGKQWVASPRRRTVYILSGLTLVETIQALVDSLLALHEAVKERPLHLVPVDDPEPA